MYPVANIVKIMMYLLHACYIRLLHAYQLPAGIAVYSLQGTLYSTMVTGIVAVMIIQPCIHVYHISWSLYYNCIGNASWVYMCNLGLSLICFLFYLLFYSAILKKLPDYSRQCTDYSLSTTHYSH